MRGFLNLPSQILIRNQPEHISKGVLADNATEPVPGLSNFINLHFVRAKIEGFNCLDYLDRAGEAVADLGKWFGEGKIKYRADIINGLENAVTSFDRLFDGSAMGKLMVKVSDEPSVG